MTNTKNPFHLYFFNFYFFNIFSMREGSDDVRKDKVLMLKYGELWLKSENVRQRLGQI